MAMRPLLASIVACLAVVHGAPVVKQDAALGVTAKDICDGASDLEAHWGGVEKNGAGRVTETAFVDYFLSTAFGSAVPDKLKSSYTGYLTDIFATGWAMMPHKGADETPTLGGHCFRSVATLPFEFYKDGSSGGYCQLFGEA